MRDVPSKVSDDQLTRSAIERSRLYGLLATVFRQEPSAEFLCHLKSPELMVAFAGAGVELGEEFGSGRFVDIENDLAVEYTRLFLGPGKHISPHESVQIKRGSGILWGPETSAVRQAYRAAGFDIGETDTHIPDHLSVELDFLSLLTKEEADAWTQKDHERAAKILRLEHSFISKHLGKWVGEFNDKVQDGAEYLFYRAFSQLLRSFLGGEKAEIVERLQKIGVSVQPPPDQADDVQSSLC